MGYNNQIKETEAKRPDILNSLLHRNYKNQHQDNQVIVSTINATGTNYRLLRQNQARKDKRVQQWLQHAPNNEFIFIDDSKTNIAQAKSLNNKKLTCVHYPDEFVLYNLPRNYLPSDCLLLDFDQTLTKYHTFQTYQLGASKANRLNDNIDFNQDILALLSIFPGTIIILTDHNNHAFVRTQAERARLCIENHHEDASSLSDSKPLAP